MHTPAIAAILVIHEKPVGVRLLLLRNIRNESQVYCWTASIFILDFLHKSNYLISESGRYTCRGGATGERPPTQNIFGVEVRSLAHFCKRSIEVPQVDYEKLSGDRMGETSESIRARVQAARNIQQTRFTNSDSHGTDIICNADMRVGEIRQFCKLQDEGVGLSLSKCQSLMRAVMSQLNLSARVYHRKQSVKLACTIAVGRS